MSRRIRPTISSEEILTLLPVDADISDGGSSSDENDYFDDDDADPDYDPKTVKKKNFLFVDEDTIAEFSSAGFSRASVKETKSTSEVESIGKPKMKKTCKARASSAACFSGATVLSPTSVRDKAESGGMTKKKASSAAGNSDSSSTDEAAEMETVRKTKKKKIYNYRWEKSDLEPSNRTNETNFEQTTAKDPYEYFNIFMDNDLLELIVRETNLYSAQETGSSINTNRKEIEQFIGILLYMGVLSLPSYKDYWASLTRIDTVADVMKLKRFQKLRRYLHFCDNNLPSEDRYHKVRPVLESIRKNCTEVDQEDRHSIDEMMVPYKGTRAGNLRQYIKSKPKKWGFKFFVRAGKSGIVYDFLPYAGSSTFREGDLTDEEIALGLGAEVVVKLCESISHPTNSIVYFDNFFSSIELLQYLKEEKDILGLGTIRANRLRNCEMKSDKELQREGRGSFDYRQETSSEILILKWTDNKVVTLASTAGGVEPLGKVKRWNKPERRKTEVPAPNVILQYNSHMGGVDLADMFIALYRTPLKTRRWYLGIFAQMLDLCVNNSWLIYRRERDPGVRVLPLKEFRCTIAVALLECGKAKRGRPSLDARKVKQIRTTVARRPQDSIRYDNYGHWPEFTKKGRCKFCTTGQTRITCSKCKISLCFTSRSNCFRLFHEK